MRLLIVEDDRDAADYIARAFREVGHVAEQAGESCTTQVKARVTGTVSQEDGKTWLTPSKIEKRIEKR